MREVFGDADGVYVNNTKSYIGHAMGGAAALELAGNLPSFEDGVIHPTINLDRLDPECEVKNLVANEPKETGRRRVILNMSFGMLGINSAVIVRTLRLVIPTPSPERNDSEEVVIAIKDIIATIAPDEDVSSLDHAERLRDQIDLDSMDFLDIVMELRKLYGVQVPEEDYKELATIDGCVAYLHPKLAGGQRAALRRQRLTATPRDVLCEERSG